MNRYRESKEEIKDRMIRTALDFWNIKKVENLDPFVRLLVEALSMQLHLLSDDIADIEVRTMRRLSEVLLPESVSMARPAHAIAYLDPLTDGLMTDPLSGFYSTSPFLGRKESRRYSFYPVCRTPLHRMSVKAIVVGGDVYEVLPDMEKKLVVRGESSPENHNKVFVGLRIPAKKAVLRHLSLYVDFPNVDNRNEYLRLLTYCDWRFNGLPIRVSNGLYAVEDKKMDGVPGFFRSQENDVRVSKDILSFYRKRYVTIEEEISVTEEDASPFPETKVGSTLPSTVCKEDLVWLEVEFPPQFSATVLADIQILTNAVPLVNKELHSITNSVRNDFGVIPIPASGGESLLDVLDVLDENGVRYVRTFGYKERADENFYTLRQGGCESFDQRDAKDFLLRLQNLLEEEMSIFSSSDFSHNTENTYMIERLLSKIGGMSGRVIADTEKPYYLFVEPPQGTSLFFVRYWTTLGPLSNGMRIGLSLNPQESLFGDMNPAVLVTPSLGGAAAPSESERIARFKYVLGCRNRIVTNNDIRNFCLAQLSDLISDVRIEKGVMRGLLPGEGLLRTIDVHLRPLAPMEDEKQRRQISDNLYDCLRENSPMTFNYRIFIE
ncbi:MAG: hypothetical protein WCU80_02630 [Paludibacteraceae bacterium]